MGFLQRNAFKMCYKETFNKTRKILIIDIQKSIAFKKINVKWSFLHGISQFYFKMGQMLTANLADKTPPPHTSSLVIKTVNTETYTGISQFFYL